MGFVIMAAAAALVAGIVPTNQDEPTATVEYQAEDGAHPLHGSGAYGAPGEEVRVWEHENVIKVDAERAGGWDPLRIEFAGANRSPLQVGAYPNARNLNQNPDVPGVQVIHGGLGCSTDYAEFSIDTLTRDANGAITAFDVTVTQRCDSPTAPATRATAHFRA